MYCSNHDVHNVDSLSSNKKQHRLPNITPLLFTLADNQNDCQSNKQTKIGLSEGVNDFFLLANHTSQMVVAGFSFLIILPRYLR